MEEPQPRRRWWRKKRWQVAVAGWLLLPVVWPLAVGPLAYCERRGWIAEEWLERTYRPVYLALARTPLLPAHDAYLAWWRDRGEMHAAFWYYESGRR